MSLLSDLAEAPAQRSAASRFTSACGLLYMAAGLSMLVWPGQAQVMFGERVFVGDEATLVRVVGMLLTVVGWFYFFGGRTSGRQFVAATVLDRLVLVPLVLVPTVLAGVFPRMMLVFAVLDPALALIAWHLLARRRT
jgi:hypothetical protein